ncbi:MAG: MGMT family protein [Candidatus Delongbacteria bacterium]
MKKLPLPKKEIVTDTLNTDFGWMSFAVSPAGLKYTKFMFGTKEEAQTALFNLIGEENFVADRTVTEKWCRTFSGYFGGNIKSFERIRIDRSSWSDFGEKVYMTAMSIPYGKTVSYGAIASYLGNEKASRAVGNALKRNPVAPVVPCHRVIAKDKDLCGFSATGGLKLKQKIIELEKRNSPLF